MKPGDNIYFFIQRKIYGIGKLVEFNSDCKFLNFPEANIPKRYNYEKLKNDVLWDENLFSQNNGIEQR